MKKENYMKYLWWTLIILWSVAEAFYMAITKKESKIANFLFNKVGLNGV
jgi:hypothetical protein